MPEGDRQRSGSGINPLLVPVITVMLGISGWALLRIPEVRNSLVGIASHRYMLPYNIERQRLAPRSIFYATAVIASATLIFELLRRRGETPRRVSRSAAIALVFIQVQAVIATSVFIDLSLYYKSQYQRWPWHVEQTEVLAYLTQNAYRDAETIRSQLPADTRVGMRTDLQDPYVMPALAFPVRFLDLYPVDANRWDEDTNFRNVAQNEQLSYIMDYTPENAEHPYLLRRLGSSK